MRFVKHVLSVTITLGRADLLTRNVNQHVEILFLMEGAHLVRLLRDDILEVHLCAANIC